MFEGQRLSYIVPGYTGHIPKKVNDTGIPLQPKQGTSQIPGYAGYVHSIKSENLYGDTFGKTTYSVANKDYPSGQDFRPRQKYVSSQTRNNIPPSQMLQRTAADIVGVPNKQIKVKEPRLGNPTGPEVDQFKITKTNQFRQSVRNRQNPWVNDSVVEREGKQYVTLKPPLPGYTGFSVRTAADNIFAKTFAECRKQSNRNVQKLNHQRKKNFDGQLQADVPLKF